MKKILWLLYRNYHVIVMLILAFGWLTPIEEGDFLHSIMNILVSFVVLFALFDIFYLRKRIRKKREEKENRDSLPR